MAETPLSSLPSREKTVPIIMISASNLCSPGADYGHLILCVTTMVPLGTVVTGVQLSASQPKLKFVCHSISIHQLRISRYSLIWGVLQSLFSQEPNYNTSARECPSTWIKADLKREQLNSETDHRLVDFFSPSVPFRFLICGGISCETKGKAKQSKI